ncbi:MAG: pyridoxamine 5'-phosphate oxidase [Candidatus Competibacteraceae bacterium]
MKQSLAELRIEYSRSELSKAGVDPDPLKQFQRWLHEAIEAELPEPNAMSLATAKADGGPTVRAVLLKGLEAGGFVFFTNYLSDKGTQLAANSEAALLFLWLELERQVRIEGRVNVIRFEESEAYFRTRPRSSQLGALASQQSRVVESRRLLEQRFEELDRRYAGVEIPMPAHWGGYRLVPTLLEFWQGRPSRLHDRLRYRLQPDGDWLLERLEP